MGLLRNSLGSVKTPIACSNGVAIAISKKATLMTMPTDINFWDTDCLGDFIGDKRAN